MTIIMHVEEKNYLFASNFHADIGFVMGNNINALILIGTLNIDRFVRNMFPMENWSLFATLSCTHIPYCWNPQSPLYRIEPLVWQEEHQTIGLEPRYSL